MNVNMFHETYFQFLLNENIIWIVMTEFFPKEAVLQKNKSFHFQLRKLCLKKVAFLTLLYQHVEGNTHGLLSQLFQS
jgi:hypothetical protein